MPIYEYRCSDCGHEAEVFQKISDTPRRDCPRCGRSSLVKLISAAGFQLKGTGWYATDFKGASAAKAKDKEGGEAKNKEGGEAKTGSESKSEAPAAACGGACSCH